MAAIGLLAISFSTAANYLKFQDQTETTNALVQSGEVNRQRLIADQLRELLTPAGIAVAPSFQVPDHASAKQLTLQWEASGGGKTAGTAQTSGNLAIMASRVMIGNLPRRRAVQLAESEIFIAAIDEDRRLVWWHAASDPRQLRAQTVTNTGEVWCRVIYQPNVNFSISYPDERSIKELRLYHPRWTGVRFELLLIGTISVP